MRKGEAERDGQLHEIRHNTSQLFFWTAFLGAVCATTALLYAVNRLRDQLEQLNRHQVTYRDMWAAERDRMHTEARHATGVKETIVNRMAHDWDKVEHAKFGLMRDLVARAGQSGALLEELVAGGRARPVHRPQRSASQTEHDALLNMLDEERQGYLSPPTTIADRVTASGSRGDMDRDRDGVRGANGGMSEALGERGPARLARADSIEQDLYEEMERNGHVV